MLEAKLNTGLVPEVALVVVAMRKVVAKPSQQVLELRWTDGDVLVHGNVDASADQEIKRIVAWGLAGDTAAKFGAVLEKISVKIAVRSAEQGLDERFKV